MNTKKVDTISQFVPWLKLHVEKPREIYIFTIHKKLQIFLVNFCWLVAGFGTKNTNCFFSGSLKYCSH